MSDDFDWDNNFDADCDDIYDEWLLKNNFDADCDDIYDEWLLNNDDNDDVAEELLHQLFECDQSDEVAEELLDNYLVESIQNDDAAEEWLDNLVDCDDSEHDFDCSDLEPNLDYEHDLAREFQDSLILNNNGKESDKEIGQNLQLEEKSVDASKSRATQQLRGERAEKKTSFELNNPEFPDFLK